ncbi:MAG: hypothetical protein K2I00_10935 [Ruminococcus sp.]|nr:hypothetical protein [Ruminococcus sp.]
MYYKYDFKIGILYDWTKFLIPIVITAICCISFNSEITWVSEYEILDRTADFADLLLYIFKGEKPFEPLDNENFRFPFIWLMIQLSVSFIVGKYPFLEIYDNHGSLVLIKGHSRIKWMVSKFLWIMSVCIIYYFLIFAVAVLFSFVFGYSFKFAVYPSQSFVYLTAYDTINSIPLLKLFLLPLITSIALSYFQTAVSLLFQPIYGFVSILGICGISVFTDSVYTFGNCSLLIRNEIFNISDISTNKSLIFLTIIIVISFVFCIIYFNRCDILQNRRAE